MTTQHPAERIAAVREALEKLPQDPCTAQAARMLRFAESEFDKGRKKIALDKLRRALSWLESPVEDVAA